MSCLCVSSFRGSQCNSRCRGGEKKTGKIQYSPLLLPLADSSAKMKESKTSFIPVAALPRRCRLTITHTVIQEHGEALIDASCFISSSLSALEALTQYQTASTRNPMRQKAEPTHYKHKMGWDASCAKCSYFNSKTKSAKSVCQMELQRQVFFFPFWWNMSNIENK